MKHTARLIMSNDIADRLSSKNWKRYLQQSAFFATLHNPGMLSEFNKVANVSHAS